MWCMHSKKQGTSCTGLFWDMDNWSWHRVFKKKRKKEKRRRKKNFTCRFWDFCFYIYFVFCHIHVVSDWFSNIFTQKTVHFLQPVKSKTIGIGNFKRPISQNHTSREEPLTVSYTNGQSQKVVGIWTWFGYQIKSESVLLTRISKTHFTQNVTCSLFCGRASNILLQWAMGKIYSVS